LQEVGLAGFYADAAALAELRTPERNQELLAWEARSRTGSATSAVR
jgi:hypothetical protein